LILTGIASLTKARIIGSSVAATVVLMSVEFPAATPRNRETAVYQLILTGIQTDAERIFR
jgi:hypothetical protein